jgi:hypothetical protein
LHRSTPDSLDRCGRDHGKRRIVALSATPLALSCDERNPAAWCPACPVGYSIGPHVDHGAREVTVTIGTGSSRGDVLGVDLSGHADAPLGELRGVVRRWLADEGEECVEDAALLATELVTNAYEHGGRARCFRLWRPVGTTSVRIEVDDANRAQLPVVGRSTLGEHRGRGLVLVDRFAERWGVALHAWGKTVWAEMPCRVPEQRRR